MRAGGPVTRRYVYEDLEHSMSQLEGDTLTSLRREGFSDRNTELSSRRHCLTE